MGKKYYSAAIIIMMTFISSAQHPLKHWTDVIDIRYDMKRPIVNYVLTIDSFRFTSFRIDMEIRNIPDTFRVAMVAHPEYDDQYWKYVTDLSVETKNGNGKIVREDSALWKITGNGGEAVLHYKIDLSATQTDFRAAWKAFLTPTGGLLGGPHSFMYVTGATLIPSYVSLKIPAGWQIVTGLQSTSDPATFFAPSVFTLIDDPIFIGKFKSWSFKVDGTPHSLIYWPLPGGKAFDTVLLLSSIQKLVEQASLLFGRLPYREFHFMLQDGAYGSLEHNNSVTVGAPATQLVNDPGDILSEIAHEYFHTWNLVRIRPIEYGDVSYKTPPLSKGLWYSEGLTIFYADLLSRRAGLPVFDTSRVSHMEALIRSYSSTPAYTKHSAEQISLASYGPPGMLGDYPGSTHLQGEVLGAMLDLIIRNSTNGKRSMDDVMKKMLERFSGEKGFTSKDIEQVVTEVCGCNVHQFFADHVFGKKQIDFTKHLQLIGLKYLLEWKDVLSGNNTPEPDLRIFAYQPEGENRTKIAITTPFSCWGKAGLHSGDVLKAVNGKPVSSADFRSLIRNAKMGDVMVLDIERPTGKTKISVTITGYQQPTVHITKISSPTGRQQRLYEQWSLGK